MTTHSSITNKCKLALQIQSSKLTLFEPTHLDASNHQVQASINAVVVISISWVKLIFQIKLIENPQIGLCLYLHIHGWKTIKRKNPFLHFLTISGPPWQICQCPNQRRMGNFPDQKVSDGQKWMENHDREWKYEPQS